MSMFDSHHIEYRGWTLIYVAAFIAAFFVLQTLYQNCRGTLIEHILIDEMTVAPSGKLISWITPREGIAAHGHTLMSKYAHLSVLSGCEGTEAMLMLAAAILVFPRNRRSKILGIIGGNLLIYAINQIRIISLYYCLRLDRPLFDMLHGYIAPILVIGVAGLYFAYWVSGAKPQPAA